ncbi:MAG: hypothetical protein K2P93_00485 [Alphaproteobacteria bacterium]|nr:hypothetical protein [Alphaproteobacteria bacterium]
MKTKLSAFLLTTAVCLHEANANLILKSNFEDDQRVERIRIQRKTKKGWEYIATANIAPRGLAFKVNVPSQTCVRIAATIGKHEKVSDEFIIPEDNETLYRTLDTNFVRHNYQPSEEDRLNFATQNLIGNRLCLSSALFKDFQNKSLNQSLTQIALLYKVGKEWKEAIEVSHAPYGFNLVTYAIPDNTYVKATTVHIQELGGDIAFERKEHGGETGVFAPTTWGASLKIVSNLGLNGNVTPIPVLGANVPGH